MWLQCLAAACRGCWRAQCDKIVSRVQMASKNTDLRLLGDSPQREREDWDTRQNTVCVCVCVCVFCVCTRYDHCQVCELYVYRFRLHFLLRETVEFSIMCVCVCVCVRVCVDTV